MDTQLSFLSFVTVSLVILLIPGPGVMYVVARSLSQGHMAAFVSALGLSVGVLVHVFAAIIGLSAILLSSAVAFAVVKYLGAGYLIYLGVQAILSTSRSENIRAFSHQPLRRVFFDGIIVSVFNPKIAIFFIAFLPQFVDLDAGSATEQILVLGLVYAVLALITDSTYGFLAGGIKNRLGGDLARSHILQTIAGSLLIGLGLKAAFTSQR